MSVSKYNPRIGDRRDGRILRSLSAAQRFSAYIVKKRSESSARISDSLELGLAENWLRDKRTEGYKGMGALHLFIAAYVRTVSEFPGINRFVAGRRVYSRFDIDIIVPVLRARTTESDTVYVKMRFSPMDTVLDIYNALNDAVREVRSGDTDRALKVAERYMRAPRPALQFGLGIMRFLDFIDKIPQRLLDISPFHGSLMISDMGIVGIPPVLHSLSNFGNLTLSLSLGARRRATELNDSGVIVANKYIDYHINCDSRVCDMNYFAEAFKRMQHYLDNPTMLELPPEEIKEDIY